MGTDRLVKTPEIFGSEKVYTVLICPTGKHWEFRNCIPKLIGEKSLKLKKKNTQYCALYKDLLQLNLVCI